MAKKLPVIIKKIRNNPPKPINFGIEKNISFSQLSMYSQCPKKWHLNYVEDHKTSEQSIHMTFGTAMHETIQHYLDIMYEKSGAEADRINIEEYFEERMRECYRKDYEKNKNTHFSTPEELREFFEDGINILTSFKKNKRKYFSKRGWYLAGCEIPIIISPNPRINNVRYMGYLDIVLYHEPSDTFTIIDIKTSTKGWNHYAKKDEMKQFQLILYKKFFSEQYDIPIENINVEFFIVKRKIWEDTEYPMNRIQQFKPAAGKVKLNKAVNTLNKFLNEAFNLDGSFKDRIFNPVPSKWNCTYCPFANRKDLCKEGY